MSLPSNLRIVSLVFLVLTLSAATTNAEEAPAKKKVSEARIKGMRAAIADIESGKLKQKEYPPIPYPPYYPTYIKLLKSEYGIEWEVVDGPKEPTLHADLNAEVDGYNDVMKAEAEHRHGRGILRSRWRKPRNSSSGPIIRRRCARRIRTTR